MPAALEGMRVLELGEGKALAYCGKLLRDLGAEVIKVEPPQGDKLREYGPFPADEPHPERSGVFVYLNGGKRGARLDLDGPAGREAFEDLLTGADVLLHALRPSEAAAAGLDPEALLERLPRLVVTAITAFGSSGPYAEWRGHALHASAGGGVAYRIGDPDREPIVLSLDGVEIHHAAPQAAACTVLALLQRQRDGRGQFVDLSVMEAASVAVWGHGVAQCVYLGYPIAVRSGVRNSPGRPWGVYETADGHFQVATMQQRHWEAFIAELGEPAWTADPLVRGMGDPAHLRDLSPEQADRLVRTVQEHLGPWLCDRRNEEIWEITRRLRTSFQPILRIGEVCESDEAEERALLEEQPQIESAPPLRLPRPPYLFSRTPTAPPGRAPSLAASGQVGWSRRADEAAEAPPAHATVRLPLEGVRVLDLGQVWAGPLLGRYLADFGADVVQIRTASRGPSMAGSTDPASPMAWEWTHRNRHSLALDLKQPEAVAIFRRLASVADVMLDNFTPRVLPRFGLDYEELAAECPRLVMIAMPASGRTGPWADLLTYGETLSALYGMKSLNGYPGDGSVGRVVEGAAELDPLAAGYGALAVFAALHHRQRTGEGQLIELAQGEAAFAGLGEAVVEHVWNGRELGPRGNRHRVLAPHGLYPCAGDDQWIAIACGTDEEWTALARCAGREDWLSRPRLATAAGRREARSELDSGLASWTQHEAKRDLTRRLQAAGVAAFPVLDALEVVGDEHHSGRRRHFELHPDFPADELLDGSAWHLSRARPTLRRPAVELGTDNVEVLGEYLGLTEDEVRRLEQAGVLR